MIEEWTTDSTDLYRTNRFIYDSNGIDLLQHRFNPDGENTLEAGYAYDANHPHRPIRMTNALNEVTTYTYDADQRLTSVLTPSGLLTTNIYGGTPFIQTAPQVTLLYDAHRLADVTSPAGTFTYLYPSSRPSTLISRLSLPNTSYITNTFDSMARLTGTSLKNSSHSTLNSHTYGCNAAHQRTQQVFSAGSTVDYSYDPIGQLKVTDSATASEDRGYAYDAAWNLNYRTNSTGTDSFSVNNRNELTYDTIGSYSYTDTYDYNGNLTQHNYGVGDDTHLFVYDGENRLKEASYYYLASLADKITFQYDGLSRLRIRTTYSGGTTNVIRYIYDGWRVTCPMRYGALDASGACGWPHAPAIRSRRQGLSHGVKERDNSNTPTVSYTRGSDLSGSMEGAGGIGGLLARSHGYSSGDWNTHNFYHADGNGSPREINTEARRRRASGQDDPLQPLDTAALSHGEIVTYLVDGGQALAASYRYDPYGNLISSTGGLAGANVYRLSSKEWVAFESGYPYAVPGLAQRLASRPIIP